MKRINVLILVVILMLAGTFRLYQLSHVPPSASLDEASIGYNAFSILKTGKDEYGNSFPILLRAFDDYRPGLYVYLVVPFVRILGLNVTAVRLPSVLLSIADVLLVYLIAKKLFKDRDDSRSIALFSALLLAISPWHIYISRLGHEANVGLFFVIAGTYFFVIALTQKKYFSLIMSGVAFAFSLYGYQSQKLVVPALVLLWGALFFRQLWKIKKWVIIAVIVALLVAFPIVNASLTPDAMIRFQHTSATAPDDPIMIREKQAFIDAKETNNIWGIIWYNRRIVPTKIIVNNYVSHFSLRWLFTGDKSEMFKAPYTGLLYPWELLFLVVGIIVIASYRKNIIARNILFPLILTAPLAAAFATMSPHAMRSYTFIPALQVVEAMGLVSLLNFFNLNKRVGVALVLIIMTLSGIYFAREYFIEFPKDQSESYQYALHQAIQYVFAHESEYNNIVLSNDRGFSQSYMFYLFDARYDPAKYLAAGGTSSGGFAQWHKIGKVSFRPIVWKTEHEPGKTLYIGNTMEFGPDAQKIGVFTYLDGTVGAVAVSRSL